MKNKGRTRNRLLALAVAVFTLSVTASAQRNTGRLSLGAGLLYRNGMDLTLAYEHETNYNNAWEFFANGYLQWKDCETCGHICPESFWRNYRSYGFGVAYKPCVVRGRNHYGMGVLLAGEGRRDDKGSRPAAGRCRARRETAGKITDEMRENKNMNR